MKNVMKALAVVAVSTLLVGCGNRPVRPQAAKDAVTDADTSALLSKNVVNVVTKKDLDKKVLKVAINGDIQVSPCQGEMVSKLHPEASKYTLVPGAASEFGIHNVHVVHEYDGKAGAEKRETFQLLVADSCTSTPTKYEIDVVIPEDEIESSEVQTAGGNVKTYKSYSIFPVK